MSARPVPRPRLLIIGPLPPPFGGVGVQVEAIRRSPLADLWEIDVFDTSKPQQQGKPSTVTAWDVAWTLWHLLVLPVRLTLRRPQVVLVEATADTGFFRDVALAFHCWTQLVPVVYHWHGAPDSPQFPGTGVRRAFFDFGVWFAARFVVLADSYVPFFARYVPLRRLAWIPNFLDGERFAAPDRPEPERLRLLFVGRLGPQKGTDVLLEAIERARATHPAIEAVLVGDGESREAFDEAASHPLVREGVVRLAGRMGDERLDEYRRADVFVLPTRADSFPLAVVEAMAASLPIVASDVGAIRWMLGDGQCGVLVPPADAASLARAITDLASSPPTRRALGAHARERQQALFDARTVWRRWDEELRAACGWKQETKIAKSSSPAPAGDGLENSWTRT